MTAKNGRWIPCRICTTPVYITPCREKKLKWGGVCCSNKCYGVYRSGMVKGKNNPAFGKKRPDLSARNRIALKNNKFWIGRHHRPESLLKMSASKRHYTLEERKTIRDIRVLGVYKSWRRRAKMVTEKCYLCGAFYELVAHHIVPVIQCVRTNHRDFIVSDRNRVILCRSCHVKVHFHHPDTINPDLVKKLQEDDDFHLDQRFVITGDVPK